MILSEILRQKGSDVVSVPPGMPLTGVLAVLGQNRIGAALVIENGLVAGIVSERDIVRNLWRHGRAALEMTAGEAMTRELTTGSPRTTVAEAMQMMTEGRFRHLPVLEAGRLIGLVSIGDVVKARVGEQEQENLSLRAYIAGAA
ncbi:MAG TPA: CBS domain-containing protein [Acetobacteraceae bacterium]|nr:CBS domain-containing protein [Acetobacteraceae bacterium]